MKISIITPTFNSEKHILDCLNSINIQTYDDIEHLIIDGNSTDSTIRIIEANQKSTTKWVSEADYGIYDAMNKGIKAATGSVIGILNSDDIYPDSEVLSDVMDCFKSDPQLDILFGDLVYVKNSNTNMVVRKWKSFDYYNRFFEDGNVPPHPTLFVRANVYKKAGLFDIQYMLAADYEFMFRIFKRFHFKNRYLNRLIVKMRLGGATNRSFKNILGGNKEILLAWSNNGFKVPLMLMPLKIIKRLNQFI